MISVDPLNNKSLQKHSLLLTLKVLCKEKFFKRQNQCIYVIFILEKKQGFNSSWEHRWNSISNWKRTNTHLSKVKAIIDITCIALIFF